MITDDFECQVCKCQATEHIKFVLHAEHNDYSSTRLCRGCARKLKVEAMHKKFLVAVQDQRIKFLKQYKHDATPDLLLFLLQESQ